MDRMNPGERRGLPRFGCASEVCSLRHLEGSRQREDVLVVAQMNYQVQLCLLCAWAPH